MELKYDWSINYCWCNVHILENVYEQFLPLMCSALLEIKMKLNGSVIYYVATKNERTFSSVEGHPVKIMIDIMHDFGRTVKLIAD